MRDRERTRAATIVAHPLGGDPQRAVSQTAGEERRKCDGNGVWNRGCTRPVFEEVL